ncbi:MAG TPA: hypothetical protein VIC51_09190, partial [Psychromonas sp.]
QGQHHQRQQRRNPQYYLNVINSEDKMNKPVIYCMYDSHNKTWNIMSAEDNSCIHYGNIDGLNNWLEKNKGDYTEVSR